MPLIQAQTNRSSVRSTRAATAILGAFVGAGEAMSLMKRLRSVTDFDFTLPGHMRTYEFLLRYIPVLSQLRKRHGLAIVPKRKIDLPDLTRRLMDSRPWQDPIVGKRRREGTCTGWAFGAHVRGKGPSVHRTQREWVFGAEGMYVRACVCKGMGFWGCGEDAMT